MYQKIKLFFFLSFFPIFFSIIIYYFQISIFNSVNIKHSDNESINDSCRSFDSNFCFQLFESNKKNFILLGNSQLTSINEIKKNDKNICSRLSDTLALNKLLNFRCYSFPNLNMEEIKYIFDKYIVQNDYETTILLPLFYDDFARENKIRQSLYIESDNLHNDNSTNLALSPKYLSFKNDIFLKNKEFIYSNLIKLRNAIFLIDEFSIRKRYDKIYFNNLKIFEGLINDITSRDNIKIITFIPPIRSDYELPFEMDNYIQFKNYINSKSVLKNFSNYNIENILDNNDYGFDNNGSVDFIHLKNEGHKKVSNYIISKINDF